MRINDKHLANFAASNSPPDKEGWLLKRGEVNKAFQKRYFSLKGNLLFYFEKKGDKEPIGVIILEGCTVELTENSDAFTFELVFQGSGSRTYILSAESQEEMEAWMKAITCANYDYMRLMVSELQRQLDELTLEQAAGGSAPWNKNGSTKNSTPPSQLVDLSSFSGNSANQARFNPFNSGTAGSDNVDMFGATPFNSDMKSNARTFDEMHAEFGIYIKEKMDEAQQKNQPLIRLDSLIS